MVRYTNKYEEYGFCAEETTEIAVFLIIYVDKYFLESVFDEGVKNKGERHFNKCKSSM
ncbi:MAG: hypothetical protein N4A49_04090 [Marinifilaceae bacterium]|nr:hypothetical protein [Marinifilaceae bacterium]